MANQVAIVVNDDASLVAADTVWRDLVSDLGYTYDIYDVNDLTTTDTQLDDGGARLLIIISESISSSDLGSKLKDAATDIIYGEGGVLDDHNLSSTGARTRASTTAVNMRTPAHVLHAGAAASASETGFEVSLLSSGSLQGNTSSEFHSNTTLLGIIDANSEYAIAYWPASTAVYNSDTTSSARYWYGASRGDSISNWTDDGYALAERMVEHAVSSTYADRQLIFPTADILKTGWTLSSGTDAYALVDDDPPVLTSDLRTENNPSSLALVLQWDATAALPSNDHPRTIAMAGRRSAGSKAIDVTMEWRQDYVSEASLGTLLATVTETGWDTSDDVGYLVLRPPDAAFTSFDDATESYVRIVVDAHGVGSTTSFEIYALHQFMDAGSGGASYTDNLGVQVDFTEAMIDALSAVDYLAAQVDVTTGGADTVQLVESLDVTFELGDSLAETVAFLDSLAAEAEFSATLADTLAALDSVAAETEFTAALTDTLAALDSVGATVELTVTITDILRSGDAYLDNLSVTFDVTATITDTSGFAESVQVALDLTADSSDVVAFLEALAGEYVFYTTHSDSKQTPGVGAAKNQLPLFGVGPS